MHGKEIGACDGAVSSGSIGCDSRYSDCSSGILRNCRIIFGIDADINELDQIYRRCIEHDPVVGLRDTGSTGEYSRVFVVLVRSERVGYR